MRISKLFFTLLISLVIALGIASSVNCSEVKQGDKVTIVAYSQMVFQALSAAEKLAAEGISAEIVDPRTLNPLDMETILGSVKKTGRLVVAHEAVKSCGFGA